MKRRILTVALTAAMVLSLLAGCGSGGSGSAGSGDTASNAPAQTQAANTASDNKETQAPAADAGSADQGGAEAGMTVEIDPATGFPLSANQGYPKKGSISIWHVWSSNYLNSFDEVAITPVLEEMTGIHVDWTTVDRTERDEKFGIMLSSGNIPDLVYAQTSQYPGGIGQAIEDGVFMDVTEFAQQYVPNYIALLDANPEVKKAASSDDGRLLCFYQLACTDKGLEAEKEFLGLFVRGDWLEDCGLEAPVTIEDWHTMLTAFKEKEGATAPLMVSPKATLINGAFASAFGVMQDFYQENGTVKYGPCEPGYKDFIETFRQWYAEGLIDQNFMTNNVERFPDWAFTTTGQTGAFTHAYSQAYDAFYTSGRVDDPNFSLIPVQNPVLNAGDTVYALPLSAGIVGDPMYVSANPSDPEALGAWLNFCYSKEGAFLQGFGVEGVHYNVVDGEIEYTEEITNKADYTPNDAYGLAVANYRFGLSNWYGSFLSNGKELAEKNAAIEDIWTSQDMSKYISTKITLTPEESERYNTLMADLQTLTDENLAKFVMGTQSMDEWDNFVAQLHERGIDECIAIKQAALDRFNAR